MAASAAGELAVLVLKQNLRLAAVGERDSM